MRYCSLVIVYLLLSLASFAQNQKMGDNATDTLPKPEEKHLLAFPFILRSQETSWGFGGIMAVFFKPKMLDSSVRTSDVNFLALYTLRKQQIFVANSTIYFPHENEIIHFQSSYSYFPDDFWGLGNGTPQIDKTAYTQHQFLINVEFLQRIVDKLYAGVNYLYQNTSNITAATDSTFNNIIGFNGGNVSGIGPMLSWDSRNASYSPTAGFFAEIKYAFFDSHIGSNFNFSMFDADVRKYISLTESKNTILALQGIASFRSGDVPYRQLAKLGGTDMMRGFYAGRFTDKNLMAAQAEVRQHLFWRVGAVAFGAMGEVGPTLKDFYLSQMHYSYGAGLRFALSQQEKLNLRIDYGRTLHTSTVNLQIREAF